MFFVIYDLQWMSFNVVLALVPVFFGFLMIKTRIRYLQVLFAGVWLVFLPNTIYLLTDVIHLFEDWERPILLTNKLIIAGLYISLVIIGIFTFVLSLHPIEKILKKQMHYKTALIILINFIIGFGMVLGRIERTNSWEVVTNTSKVLVDTFHVVTSSEKIVLFIVFGLLCNIVYFSCRHLVMKEVRELESL